MTTPVLKIKVLPKTVIKGKMDVRFPANVETDAFLTVAKSNGKYTFDVDYTILDPTPIVDPSTAIVAIYDQTSRSWKVGSITGLISGSQVVQTFTDGGAESIRTNAGVALVNQTVGAPKTLTLPLASEKLCPVLVADWKGDAGTNNITINLTGSDKFPGGLTSWKIAADTGSVFLRPISGVGYTL